MQKKLKKTFSPTKAIVNNSLRGKALFEKSKSNSEAHAAKKLEIERLAKSIESGSLDLEQVKELYSFLNKAQSFYKPLNRVAEGILDADSTAFIAAGGSSALAWSRIILKQEGILKSYTEDISDEEINSEQNIEGIKIPVTKAVNEELKQATFIVMVPDVADAHGDITSEEEVRKACFNFNKSLQTANLFHLVETNTYEFAESYVTPVDFILGDRFVKKGTWLCTIQCLSDEIWGMIKSGEINGVSIGALASVENIEED